MRLGTNQPTTTATTPGSTVRRVMTGGVAAAAVGQALTSCTPLEIEKEREIKRCVEVITWVISVSLCGSPGM